MPLSKIQLQPGIFTDDTVYSQEGKYIDSDKVRFMKSRPEKIDKEKNPDKYEKQLQDLAARLIIMLGIPAPSLVKWKRNFEAIVDDPTMDEGEIILRLLNWSEYQITGPKTKEAQQRWESTRPPYSPSKKYHYQ